MTTGEYYQGYNTKFAGEYQLLNTKFAGHRNGLDYASDDSQPGLVQRPGQSYWYKQWDGDCTLMAVPQKCRYLYAEMSMYGHVDNTDKLYGMDTETNRRMYNWNQLGNTRHFTVFSLGKRGIDRSPPHFQTFRLKCRSLKFAFLPLRLSQPGALQNDINTDPLKSQVRSFPGGIFYQWKTRPILTTWTSRHFFDGEHTVNQLLI